MDYHKIVNPKTGRKVSIYNKKGRGIIRNYLIQIAGATTNSYASNTNKPITKKMAGKLLDYAFIEDVDQREKLLPQLQALEGEIPVDFASQYLITYASLIERAQERYIEGLATINEDIEDIRQETEEVEGKPYTAKQEASDRLALKKSEDKQRDHRLAIAEGYSNDLSNYASALLEEWKVSGSWGSLL